MTEDYKYEKKGVTLAEQVNNLKDDLKQAEKEKAGHLEAAKIAEWRAEGVDREIEDIKRTIDFYEGR